MHKFHFTIIFLISFSILTSLLTSCAGNKTSTSVNLANNRLAAEAGIPDDSENTIGGVVPNVKPIVEASILAAANIEAVNIKTAVRLYLTDHPSSSPISSENLWPGYTSNIPNAIYTIHPTTLQITRVSTIQNGWKNIVFSISRQKWLEGNPDSDHIDDQDIP